MEVISLINNRRLVKGGKYIVERLYNSKKFRTRRYYNNKGSITLKIYGDYYPNQFTTLDGKPLPNIDMDYDPIENEKETIKVGDILIPKTDNLKTLRKGKKYRVIEVEKRAYTYSNCHRVKFEGLNRFYFYSYWNYDKIPHSEVRDMVLDSLFDDTKMDIITEVKSKMDIASDKNYELIKILGKGMCDPYYNTLPFIDWVCTRVGKSHNVKEKDFEPLMKLTLEEIIEIIHKNNNI